MRTLDPGNAGSRDDRARRGIPAGSLLLVFSFLQVMMHVGRHQACQQLIEGRVVVDTDRPFTGVSVLQDVDPGEEGLVEQAPGDIRGLEVSGVAVPSEIKTLGQVCPGLLVAVIGGAKLLLDVGQLDGDPVLLGFQQVQRDGSGVVGVKELLPLGSQGGLLGFELVPLTGGHFLQRIEVLEDEFLDVVA